MKTKRERIIDLRMEKGLSAQEVNRTLGWNKNLIERFENGRLSPNKEEEATLAHFFGVSIAYLRCETNDKTRQDSWMDLALDSDPAAKIASKDAISSPVPPDKKSDNENVSISMISALLRSDEAQSIIRQIVREELAKKPNK